MSNLFQIVWPLQWDYFITIHTTIKCAKTQSFKEQTALGFIALEHQSGATTNLRWQWQQSLLLHGRCCSIKEASTYTYSIFFKLISSFLRWPSCYLLLHFAQVPRSLRSRDGWVGVEGQTVSPLAVDNPYRTCNAYYRYYLASYYLIHEISDHNSLYFRVKVFIT